MSTEPYTADETDIVGCWARAAQRAGRDSHIAMAEAQRGISKIKAEALREAAGELFDTMLPAECAHYLNERADRIEEEA